MREGAYGLVAQLAEHPALTREVGGSLPPEPTPEVSLFRVRLIGRTRVSGARYRGSSPWPGADSRGVPCGMLEALIVDNLKKYTVRTGEEPSCSLPVRVEMFRVRLVVKDGGLWLRLRGFESLTRILSSSS
jgi:hypothetical protein